MQYNQWLNTLARATLHKWRTDAETAIWMEKTEISLSLETDEIHHLKKVIAKAKKENILLPHGLMDLRLHDLRRTFASYQAITGANLQTIGKSLGHKNSDSTKIYARLNLDAVRSSMEKATEAMLE